MNKHVHSVDGLTKNQTLVMDALSRAKGAMSAYTILDELRDEGFKAPLQVYRALDKLVEFGLAHKLESLNAFIACQHPSCDGETTETVVFTICENCERVEELVNDKLLAAVNGLAGKIDFALKQSVIELRGVCSTCRNS